MKVLRFPASIPPPINKPVAVVLGNFDGVHLGHRMLLETARKQKGPGGSLTAISFYPHPLTVLRPDAGVRALTPAREKIRLLDEFGVSHLYLVRFTAEIAAMGARQFLQQVVIDRVGCDLLVIGEDAHVGKGREGSAAKISEILGEIGAQTVVVPTLCLGEDRPRSGKIRALIQAGEIEGANKLLGRPYRVIGRVVRGAGRGRSIGIPTANLGGARQLLPAAGVYVTTAILDGRRLPAVTNIGTNPTFENGATLRVETHILDFRGGDLYRCRLGVEVLHRLRGEQRFPDAETLVRQIAEDLLAAREYHRRAGNL